MSGGPGVSGGRDSAAAVTLAAGQRGISGGSAGRKRQGSGEGSKRWRCNRRDGLRYILVWVGDFGATGANTGRGRGEERQQADALQSGGVRDGAEIG